MFKAFPILLMVGVLYLVRSQDSTASLDADGICQALYPTDDSSGDIATGSVVGCKLNCKVSNSKTGRTTIKTPVDVPNYISCGTKMTCVNGTCKYKDTLASKACSMYSSVPNAYGEKTRGLCCQSTCYNVSDDNGKEIPPYPALYEPGTYCALYGDEKGRIENYPELELKRYANLPKVGECVGQGGGCYPAAKVTNATTTCKELLEQYESNDKQVTGLVQGCELKCSVTSTNDKDVKSTASTFLKMPNFGSCGTNQICYKSNCVKNNNKASDVCRKEITDGRIPCNYGVVGPPCKVTCHFMAWDNDDRTQVTNMPNGTVCVIGTQLGKCQAGLCKKTTNR